MGLWPENIREAMVFKVRERLACYDANGHDSVEQGTLMGREGEESVERPRQGETGPRRRQGLGALVQGSALAARGTGPRAESRERKEHVAADARRWVGAVVGVCASSLQTVTVVSAER